MKTVVIGANGQLGSDCVLAFEKAGHEVAGLTHQDIEIAEEPSVADKLTSLSPGLVINTSAMHNVDACEKSPLQAFAVNAVGARSLARLSNQLGFVLIHISTDYVFDGNKNAPYLETDVPRPLNVYGNSKLAGEIFVQTIARRYFVVRVSAIYGANPCRAKGGNNFIKLMLKLARERGEVKVVDDEFVSPTYTPDVADQLVRLAETDAHGVVHCTANGSCSWYEFAEAIFKLTQTKVKLLRAAPGEFPMKVPRPRYSVLENSMLDGLGIDRMPLWKDSLARYIAELQVDAPVASTQGS
jgi:dTDP-4-dehydrorhamnose reductase